MSLCFFWLLTILKLNYRMRTNNSRKYNRRVVSYSKEISLELF